MYLLIIIFFVFVLLVTYIYAGLKGAPWVPTKKIDVERFLKLAQIKPGQQMYDLGCGDGRIVCAAAKAGAKTQGFEVSLFPYFLSKIYRLFQKNKSNIKISFKNIMHSNLADADIVYFFLMPKIYPKLQEKLNNELKSGAKVITYVWPIKTWQPVKVDVTQGYPNMYLYQK